jgi:hypothetical protein
MTTPELLMLMRLLSAIESSLLTAKVTFPLHLSDEIETCTNIIEREILGRQKDGS